MSEFPRPRLDGWVHDDGTACDVLLAPDDGERWWCTVHQQHVRRPDGEEMPDER